MKLSNSQRYFLNYLTVGLSGFCLQILINKFFSSLINLSYNYSLLIGILCGTTWNFYFFNIFVFKKNKLVNKYFFWGLLKFYFTNSFSLIINYTIALVLYKNFRINDFFSQVFAISFIVIFNYFVYSRFIWKKN